MATLADLGKTFKGRKERLEVVSLMADPDTAELEVINVPSPALAEVAPGAAAVPAESSPEVDLPEAKAPRARRVKTETLQVAVAAPQPVVNDAPQPFRGRRG